MIDTLPERHRPATPAPAGAQVYAALRVDARWRRHGVWQGTRHSRHLLRTSILIASCALSACAGGPKDIGSSPRAEVSTAECPDVTRLHAAQLHGSWTLELVQAGQRGQLTLRQHPEFSASLRGEFRYGGQRSIASGDVEGGEFNLDESRDGKSLFAFWSGRLVPSACGAEIRGRWQPLAREGQPAPAESDFILRRAGW